jgi:hypothetical protein
LLSGYVRRPYLAKNKVSNAILVLHFSLELLVTVIKT